MLFCLPAECQKSDLKFRKPDETSAVLVSRATESSWIAPNPVTNREYITCLVWLYTVYKDYPEVFYKAFPGIETINAVQNYGMDQQDALKKLISQSGIASDYVFNPAYIDSPVTGLIRSQCMNFLAWMTDRYNERALIRNR